MRRYLVAHHRQPSKTRRGRAGAPHCFRSLLRGIREARRNELLAVDQLRRMRQTRVIGVARVLFAGRALLWGQPLTQSHAQDHGHHAKTRAGHATREGHPE